MQCCVGLATNRGRPFKLFDDPEFKTITTLANNNVKEKITINASTVKEQVHLQANQTREEIKQKLKGKLLSFALDMATCRNRSFFGE